MGGPAADVRLRQGKRAALLAEVQVCLARRPGDHRRAGQLKPLLGPRQRRAPRAPHLCPMRRRWGNRRVAPAGEATGHPDHSDDSVVTRRLPRTDLAANSAACLEQAAQGTTGLPHSVDYWNSSCSSGNSGCAANWRSPTARRSRPERLAILDRAAAPDCQPLTML